MSTRTAGRTLTVAALAATLIGAAGGSPAGAAPAAGPPYTASTATTLLRSAGTEGLAEVTITAVRGAAPTLAVELYLTGYRCAVSSGAAAPTLTSLESAQVAGTFGYSCEAAGGGQGLTGDPVTGTAEVALGWTGAGEARRAPLDHCVGRYRVRPAEVTGSVTLTGDLVGSFDTVAPGDAHLAYDHHVCPPGIP